MGKEKAARCWRAEGYQKSPQGPGSYQTRPLVTELKLLKSKLKQGGLSGPDRAVGPSPQRGAAGAGRCGAESCPARLLGCGFSGAPPGPADTSPSCLDLPGSGSFPPLPCPQKNKEITLSFLLRPLLPDWKAGGGPNEPAQSPLPPLADEDLEVRPPPASWPLTNHASPGEISENLGKAEGPAGAGRKHWWNPLSR